jgi:hypothetical protein
MEAQSLLLRALQGQIELLRETIQEQGRRITVLEGRLEGRLNADLNPLPPFETVPITTGLLKLVRLRGFRFTTTVSSQGKGNPDLLPEAGNEWYSQNTPNSWIQWTMPAGVLVIIEHVKMKGRPNDYGVVNFAVEGSVDGRTWLSIMRSETCGPRFQNWETEAWLPDGNGTAFSMIRLMQTGKCHRPNQGDACDFLVLQAIDFGGKIVIRPPPG